MLEHIQKLTWDVLQLAKQLTSLVGALSVSAALTLSSVEPAHALLNSPNATIARTVDAALRRAIPAFNSDIRTAQARFKLAYASLQCQAGRCCASQAASWTCLPCP